MDAALPDQRLNQRLTRIAQDLAQHPQSSIPQASGDWGQACAAYRFFDNDRIDPPDILAAHQARTRQRAAREPWVLAVTDTTSLNYEERPDTSGLGPISTSAERMLGLFYHTVLAFRPDGLPLGVVDAQCWARDPQQFGSKLRRHQRAIGQKESVKWLRSFAAVQAAAEQTPQTRWVMIADREADLYELVELAPPAGAGPSRLIRALHNRNLIGRKRRLFAHLAKLPLAGTVAIQVPRRRGPAARTATLEVRFGEVDVRAPKGKGQQSGQRVWVIEAREPRRSQRRARILWRLLSTEPIRTLEEAIERLRWYCVRWGIEVFHKVLKSGCAVEAVQLQTAARLQRYVTLKLVIAWQALALVKSGRQQPDRALTEILEETEWRALRAWERDRQKRSHQKAQRLPRRPTVRDGLLWIGRLGGHLGRRGDGWPGPLRLARGLERLHYITIGWRLAHVAKKCA